MVEISTSTSGFNDSLVALVKRTLEEELRPTLPFVRECIPAKFVAGTDNTMRFLRVADMDVTTGAPSAGTPPWLSEGDTPDIEDLDFGFEEFSAAQAGRILGMTDVSQERWASGSLLGIAAEKITTNMAQTTDKYVSDVILTGDNTLYVGNGGSNGAITGADVVDAVTLRRAVATMKVDLIPTFGGYYHAIVNPGVVFDIESDEGAGGWLEANKYAGSLALMSGEIGKYAGVRFIESTNAPVLTGIGVSSVDVYSTVVFGPGAWVFGDWGTAEVFVTPPGGKGDELHQRAAVGWKAWMGAMITGDDSGTGVRYLRIVSASGL